MKYGDIDNYDDDSPRFEKFSKNRKKEKKQYSQIPKNEYIGVEIDTDKGVDVLYVVTIELVRKYHTQREIEHFCDWISGQTTIMLDDGESGIYVDDYERWLRQGKKHRQNSGDWD